MKKSFDEYGRYGFQSMSDSLRERYPFNWYLEEVCEQNITELDEEDREFFRGAYDNFIGVILKDIREGKRYSSDY